MDPMNFPVELSQEKLHAIAGRGIGRVDDDRTTRIPLGQEFRYVAAGAGVHGFAIWRGQHF